MKRFVFSVRWLIVAQVVCDGCACAALSCAPIVQKWFLDYGMNGSIGSVVIGASLYGILLILYSLLTMLYIYLSFLTGIGFENATKKEFFRKIFNLKKEDFMKKSVGEYISIQGNDITALEQDYLQPVISTICFVIRMFIYAIVLFLAIDYKVASVIILSSIFAVFIPRLFNKRLSDSRKEYQLQQASYVSVITDLLEGFNVINLQTIDNITKKHDEEMDCVSSKRKEYGKNKSLVLGISELSTKVIKILTFSVIALLLYRKSITVGVCVAALSYIEAFITPIDSILYNLTTIQSMDGVKKKFISLINFENVIIVNKKEKLANSIELKNIDYQKENFSISNVNLKLEKGKKYAVVGESGSGKSTLLKLLSGHIKPTSGEIMIDGRSVINCDTSKLVAYVDQNEHIFQDSVTNNITVFDSYKINTEMVKREFDDCSLLLKTINRNNSEKANQFSGGEKQIISLLRSIAKNSEIMLMDEPFSAIDTNERKKIENHLLSSDLFKDKTIVVVTHDVTGDSLSKYDYIIKKDDDNFSIIPA